MMMGKIRGAFQQAGQKIPVLGGSLPSSWLNWLRAGQIFRLMTSGKRCANTIRIWDVQRFTALLKFWCRKASSTVLILRMAHIDIMSVLTAVIVI